VFQKSKSKIFPKERISEVFFIHTHFHLKLFSLFRRIFLYFNDMQIEIEMMQLEFSISYTIKI